MPSSTAAHAQERSPSPGQCPGVRHAIQGRGDDTLVCFGLQLVAPIGRSPLPALPLDSFTPWAVVPIGLSPPSLAYLSVSTSLSFPLVGCANGGPGLSLFHCSVSGPHGGGQLPSLLARCVQVDTPYRRWGTPPQRRLLGPRRSTCGVNFPDRGTQRPSACPFPRSVLLVASAPCAPPCVRHVCIVSPFPSVAWVPFGAVGGGWRSVTGRDGLFSRVAWVPCSGGWWVA